MRRSDEPVPPTAACGDFVDDEQPFALRVGDERIVRERVVRDECWLQRERLRRLAPLRGESRGDDQLDIREIARNRRGDERFAEAHFVGEDCAAETGEE